MPNARASCFVATSHRFGRDLDAAVEEAVVKSANPFAAAPIRTRSYSYLAGSN
jgi:hypothetical protein